MNYIFGGGGGVGRKGQINKYVWGYDGIMIFVRFGESFLSIWGFLKVKVQNWKKFWGC